MSEMFSLQKDKIRVLLLEGVNDSAVELIKSAGYTNLTHLKTALDEAHLIEALQGVHLLGIRSRTQLTGKVLEAANRLIAPIDTRRPVHPARGCMSDLHSVPVDARSSRG